MLMFLFDLSFMARKIISLVEPSQSLVGAKTGNPRDKKTLDYPQSDVTRSRLEPTVVR